MRGMSSQESSIPVPGPRPGYARRLGAAATAGAIAVALAPAVQALAVTSSSSAPAALNSMSKHDAGDPSSTQSTTANVSVGPAIVLSGLTSSFVLSGLPGDTVTDFGAVSMNVLTNNSTGYNVTVQAASPNLTDAGGATIPVTDLLVNDSNVGGTSGFVPISSTAATQVYTQPGPSGDTGDTVTNDYIRRGTRRPSRSHCLSRAGHLPPGQHPHLSGNRGPGCHHRARPDHRPPAGPQAGSAGVLGGRPGHRIERVRRTPGGRQVEPEAPGDKDPTSYRADMPDAACCVRAASGLAWPRKPGRLCGGRDGSGGHGCGPGRAGPCGGAGVLVVVVVALPVTGDEAVDPDPAGGPPHSEDHDGE